MPNNTLTETPAPTYADLIAQIAAEKARAETRFSVGDRVQSHDTNKFAGLGVVIKVNPKTVVVRLDKGVEVRFTPSLLSHADAAAPAAVVTQLPILPFIHAGTVVTLSGKYAGIYIVIKGGDDRVNVAKIGGDNGRYIRANVAGVTVIDPSRVTVSA